MRKVILLMDVTLDGFVGGPNGEMDWMSRDFEMSGYAVGDLLPAVDSYLVGRKTYQSFEQAWPAMAANPASPKELVQFAHWIEHTPKVVFSNSVTSVAWENSSVVGGDVAAAVARLKRQPGKDMVLWGGAGILGTFTQLGLIDEYRLKVHPVAIGAGKPLFANLKDKVKLHLTLAKSFSAGGVCLYYTPEAIAA